MEAFTQILQDATAHIDPEYFLLPIHGSLAVYRERVYCYELYHQMRRLWPQDCIFRLNGELDKRAHPYFRDSSEPKPDFLVHEPGTANNFAVVEVKAARASEPGISKDINTLVRFAREIGYRRALYLIYGEDAGNTIRLVRRYAAEIQAPVELWVHAVAGEAAFRLSNRE